MIFFSMLTCTIRSQGSSNKMAAAYFLWLQFPNNRSSIQPFFFKITLLSLVFTTLRQPIWCRERIKWQPRFLLFSFKHTRNVCKNQERDDRPKRELRLVLSTTQRFLFSPGTFFLTPPHTLPQRSGCHFINLMQTKGNLSYL